MAKLVGFVGSEFCSDVLISTSDNVIIPAHELVISTIPIFEDFLSAEKILGLSERYEDVIEYKKKYKSIINDDSGKNRLIIPVPYTARIVRMGLAYYYGGNKFMVNRNNISEVLEYISFIMYCGQPKEEYSSVNIQELLLEFYEDIKGDIKKGVKSSYELEIVYSLATFIKKTSFLRNPTFLHNNAKFMGVGMYRKITALILSLTEKERVFLRTLLVYEWRKAPVYGFSNDMRDEIEDYKRWIRAIDRNWLNVIFEELQEYILGYCDVYVANFEFFDNMESKQEKKDISSESLKPIDKINQDSLNSTVLEDISREKIIIVPKNIPANVINDILANNKGLTFRFVE